MDLEELIALAKRNPVIVVWLALMLFGTIARKLAGKKEEEDARGGRGGAAPRAAPTELEERIRRNFEEMLRRRAAGGETAASAPVAAPIPAATRALAQKPRRNYDEAAPKEPVQVRIVRKEPTRVRHSPAEATAGDRPRMAVRRLAGSSLPAKGAPARRATRATVTRRLLRDRTALRRAILFNEVLGPPRALREETTPA